MNECLNEAILDTVAYEKCWRSQGCRGNPYGAGAEDVCKKCPQSKYRTLPLHNMGKDLCVAGCDHQINDEYDCKLTGIAKTRFLKRWDARKQKEKAK